MPADEPGSKKPERIHIHLEFDRRSFIAACAAVLVCAGAASLDSETLTMSTTYPAPSGVYQTLIATGQALLARDGNNVGIGLPAPAMKLDIAQNTGLRLGRAYLSSGGDFTHLANNEWFNGAAWATNGTPGVLYQQTGQTHNWYKHDAAGGHTKVMTLDSSGNLALGTGAPGAKLDVPQNSEIRLGQAYLSSGGDYTHLANNEWYDGSAWHTNGNAGVLYQQAGTSHNWYYHNAGGGHAGLMSLDSGGNLNNAGYGNFTDVYLHAPVQGPARWASQSAGAYFVDIGTLNAYHNGCNGTSTWCSIFCTSACNRWCAAVGYIGGTMSECVPAGDECICVR